MTKLDNWHPIHDEIKYKSKFQKQYGGWETLTFMSLYRSTDSFHYTSRGGTQTYITYIIPSFEHGKQKSGRWQETYLWRCRIFSHNFCCKNASTHSSHLMGYLRVVSPFFRRKHIKYQLGENNRVWNMRENLQEKLEFCKTKRVAALKKKNCGWFHQRVYVQLLRAQILKAQKVAWHDCFFVLLGSSSVKAANKMLVKLTPVLKGFHKQWPAESTNRYLILSTLTKFAKYEKNFVSKNVLFTPPLYI